LKPQIEQKDHIFKTALEMFAFFCVMTAIGAIFDYNRAFSLGEVVENLSITLGYFSLMFAYNKYFKR
jgi:hypothetical protein